ncbi:uncharacterized protein LOC120327702 isoform X1 [Styela clava]
MSSDMEVMNESVDTDCKATTQDVEMESPTSSKNVTNIGNKNAFSAIDVIDGCSKKLNEKVMVIPEVAESGANLKDTSNNSDCNQQKDNDLDVKLSPPVFVNSNPFQQDMTSNDCPFQKPTVCRTHSLGASDPSPFTIRRRPARLSFANQLQSPSAFRRKLKMKSPIRGDLADEMEDNVLKRCNSAPMLNEMNDIDVRMAWHHGSVTPGSIRARRFSATVLSVNASPSAGTPKSASRLNQLKKEESIEGIQYKETAHEREVQTSIQMYNTCGELSLSDSHESLNGILSGDLQQQQTIISSTAGTTTPTESVPKSPMLHSPPVNVPAFSKQCSTRAIDFNISGSGSSIPTPPLHHPSVGGGIPSPLTISPSTGLLSLSPLPPSPTRNLGFSSTGKQCFSPSMQVPVPACLRPGSLSPSPSPTRRTFVTRRRSQSPCIVKPSALGPIKRKYDSDSEGSCSPKRMFIPGSQTAGPGGGGVAGAGHNQNTDATLPVVVTPFFPRASIHRSHSLSSSSVDSDLNVSPSPPQNGVTMGFLPSNHPLSVNISSTRDGSSGSPFQLPLHANPFLNTVGIQDSLRCSSPASSTCSSSSLEGLRDLQTYPQSHLALPSISNMSTLIKPPIKERQPPPTLPTPSSTANLTL